MNTRATMNMVLSYRTWLWWFVFVRCIIMTVATSRTLAPQNYHGGSYLELGYHHHETPSNFASHDSQNGIPGPANSPSLLARFEPPHSDSLDSSVSGETVGISPSPQKLRDHYNARSLMANNNIPKHVEILRSPSPQMFKETMPISPSPSHSAEDLNEAIVTAHASHTHERISSSPSLSPSIKALHKSISTLDTSSHESIASSPLLAQSVKDLHETKIISTSASSLHESIATFQSQSLQQTISATPSNFSNNSSSSPSPYIPLDKNQLLSLQSLGMQFNSEQDPCSDQSILCDKSYPYRHVLSLRLQFCPRDATLSTEDLTNLQTLNTLTFKDCPMLPSPLPTNLLNSLSSLTCTASLGYSPQYTSLPPLPSSWLNKFRNLKELSIADVCVNSTIGLSSIISKMPRLRKLRFSKTNISGLLPVNMWPANITHIDLSSNYINGSLPKAITKLPLVQDLTLAKNNLKGHVLPSLGNMKRLERLVLSYNALSGAIPESLAEAPSLMYLDLSHNNLTGSIPEAFNKMKNVRYLDLSHNHLKGPLPFNQSFLDKLNTLKVRGNIGICYDHKVVKSSFLEGVPDCDSTGMPVVPSTESEKKPKSKGGAGADDGGATAASGGPMGQIIADDSSAVAVVHHRRHGSVLVGVAIALVIVFVIIVVSVLISRCRNRK